ncbi:benzoylformate decarboxylase [Herbihabitans rhizosphaerae]|uniref:Benzoylformate decarboxylase n=1 Tax=Herbihabitans rhizosphaerae TaxID=1872711 RepID=A0A4V2ETH3_9PSEU|nr:benzoylformate decarboxylase [Herbihabitans rhizosphaerae]RZS41073.1 benzoylformate decarboxylase [Herbihabitans rhizosphaerae]
MSVTVRDAVRDLLREFGTTTVFGNPGSTEAGFLTDWPSDFRYVLALHEAVAVAMADGYAQAGARPVLLNLHAAGGLGNAMGQLVNAFHNHTPMVVLAGQQDRAMLPEDPFLAFLDGPALPRPYLKAAIEPARAKDVPAAVVRAHRLAATSPRGPVLVTVPADDWDAEPAPALAGPPIRPSTVDSEALAELAAVLDNAERPAIVAGPAVDAERAVTDLVVLAERLRAGVWAAPMSARCSFPEDHPLFHGFLAPTRQAIADALAGHDAVLVLGAPAFTYHVPSDGPDVPHPRLYLISDDDSALARAPHAIGLCGAVGKAIVTLAGLVTASDRPVPPARPAPPEPAGIAATAFGTLADLLPHNALLVEEAPSHRDALRAHLPITATETGFLTIPGGTLGYGLPAAVGAALARPDRRVVAVVGDGAAMYAIQALWTAVREQAPVTVVVMDNEEYAAVRELGELSGRSRMPGTELGGIDFATLARALGCTAETVATQEKLEPALRRALAAGGPAVLHLRT